jgi:hypothetical protein
MSGVAIIHPEHGLFVGVGLGLAFWSNMDCAGQYQVPLMADEAEARAFVSSWRSPAGPIDPDTFTYHAVESVETWATIEELEAAGLSHLTLPLKAARMGPAQGSA